MEITVSYEFGLAPVTVFCLKGALDSTSYQQLQTQAEQAHTAGTRNLVLDLTEVTYISSAGLRALQHVFNLLRTSAPSESNAAMAQGLRDGTFKSPHLKLLNPSPAVLEVLKTAGFDMFLEIHHDLSEYRIKNAVATF
jgi:ABC-type transporter Mla MlaB component